MPISPLPTPPSRASSPATFATDADAFLAALHDFATEANDLADDVNADAVAAAASAATAEAARVAAVAASDFQGDYSAGTTYQIGQSVSSGGGIWIAKTVNTGITPVEGANWTQLFLFSNVVVATGRNVDCALGSYFTFTAAGAGSWTATNIPTAKAFSFILELTNGGTGAQTWFTNTRWPNGVAPTLTSAGVDVLGFITDDGGANWRGAMLMRDSK